MKAIIDVSDLCNGLHDLARGVFQEMYEKEEDCKEG